MQVSRPTSFSGPSRPSLFSQEMPAQWKLGQRVRHSSFGEGTIMDAEGTGAHARVQVNFEDVGAKWLVLAFAKLDAM